MKKIILYFFIFSNLSYTQTINDVVLKNKIKVHGQDLVLNGAGTRNKFFMDIYVGSLYVTSPANDAVSIINSNTIKSMHLYIVSSWINRRLLKSALRSELKNSSTKEEMEQLQDEIDIFLSTFDEEIKKGDKFIFNIIPDIGVEVYKNNKLIKSIHGDLFSKRLIQLWIGDTPVDKKLKTEILGDSDI
ncbi:chalcone isomerase family protein [Fusobacteria bacterium ZRK30]|nr:chalcone isomerase family protein [Fusobacteria bacterium ZRK30]